jgi:hypothetical protein
MMASTPVVDEVLDASGEQWRPIGPTRAEMAEELVLVYDLLEETLTAFARLLVGNHRLLRLDEQAAFWKSLNDLDRFYNPDETYLHAWCWEDGDPPTDTPFTSRRSQVEHFRRQVAGEE